MGALIETWPCRSRASWRRGRPHHGAWIETVCVWLATALECVVPVTGGVDRKLRMDSRARWPKRAPEAGRQPVTPLEGTRPPRLPSEVPVQRGSHFHPGIARSSGPFQFRGAFWFRRLQPLRIPAPVCHPVTCAAGSLQPPLRTALARGRHSGLAERQRRASARIQPLGDAHRAEGRLRRAGTVANKRRRRPLVVRGHDALLPRLRAQAGSHHPGLQPAAFRHARAARKRHVAGRLPAHRGGAQIRATVLSGQDSAPAKEGRQMKAASSLPFATLALAACTAGQELDDGSFRHERNSEYDCLRAYREPSGRRMAKATSHRP